MRKKLLVGLLALVMSAVSSWAAPPLDTLERALADWRLGCGGCLTRYGWDEQDLATFVAGRLASLGFATKLARRGETWWVLVAVTVNGVEKYVPVLPGLPPADRDWQWGRGVFLGRIPRTATGEVDPSYTTAEEVLPLAPNVLPAIRIRVHPASPQEGETVWFTADVIDPDGIVVQVWWDFGDGETSTRLSPDHVYTREGSYTVTLTVVDNRGGVATARVRVEVVRPLPVQPGGGCGCGG